MKKLFPTLLLAGLFAAPSQAHADPTPYISLSGGLALQNDSKMDFYGLNFDHAIKYKSDDILNGAIGLQDDEYHVEAEVGYHRHDTDKLFDADAGDMNLSLWTFMVNGYYHIDMDSSLLSPYVMLGLGLANATVKDEDIDESSSSSAFAMQAGVGLGLKVLDHLTLDFGYRFFKAADCKYFSDDIKISVASSNFLAGIRYGF